MFPWVICSALFYEYLLVSLGQLFYEYLPISLGQLFYEYLLVSLGQLFYEYLLVSLGQLFYEYLPVSLGQLFYEYLLVSLGRFRHLLAYIQSVDGVLTGCCCPDLTARGRWTCRVPVREAGLASWGWCCSDSQAAGALRNLHSPLTRCRSQPIHTARLLC